MITITFIIVINDKREGILNNFADIEWVKLLRENKNCVVKENFVK